MIFSALFTLLFSVLGAEESFTLEAESAHYEESLFDLKGEVVLKGCGLYVKAQQAQVGEERQCFLEGDVVAKYAQNMISAYLAYVDLEKHCVVFHAPEQEVQLEGEWGKLSCQRLTIKLNSSNLSSTNDHQVIAEGEVKVQAKHGEIICSDQAIYTVNPRKESTIQFMSNCEFITTDGQQVSAEKILFGTQSQNIEMEEADGHLKDDMHFAAKHLQWDFKKGAVVFSEDVRLKQGDRFSLSCDRNVEVNLDLQMKQVKKLSAKGRIDVLIAKDQPLNLSVEGELHCGEQVTIIGDKPFQIEGEMGLLEAEKGVLTIGPQNELEHFTLNGAVKFSGSCKGAVSVPPCYVYADQVAYNVRENQFVLKADPGERVLFHDRMKNLFVSAPEILLFKGTKEQKQRIQGVGDVRFSFNDREVERMKRAFQERK